MLGSAPYICDKCEREWSFDPDDGRCPLCRMGHVVPKGLYQPKQRRRKEGKTMIRCNLKRIAHKKELSLNEISRQTGVRAATLSRMANNTISRYPVEALSKLCDFLEVLPGDLIEFRKEEVKE